MHPAEYLESGPEIQVVCLHPHSVGHGWKRCPGCLRETQGLAGSGLRLVSFGLGEAAFLEGDGGGIRHLLGRGVPAGPDGR